VTLAYLSAISEDGSFVLRSEFAHSHGDEHGTGMFPGKPGLRENKTEDLQKRILCGSMESTAD